MTMLWLSWGLTVLPPVPQELIMTVQGPIVPADFGRALVHEHVMCDFIGAERTGRHRYDPDEVVRTMLPYLQEVKTRGFTGFVDATPSYIGRAPEVLRQLASLTGLHILTNTGYYGAAGDKFLPPHAFTETADQLAARWVAEWREGIDGTGIKPGFIKIGVDPGPLSDLDRKLVQAAARTHFQTGLTIACHTGEAQAALQVLEVVKSEGVDPSALIIVHADSIPDERVHWRLAEAGAWVEYDAVGAKPIDEHVRLITAMVRKGFAHRLLLSHDAGWYWVGEPDGGKSKIRPYTALPDQLVPALKTNGVDEETLEQLLVMNPQNAFTVRVRRR
ncbi:MAG: hypothetical protein IMHGJWDQ_000369 [Candidatus Fervidibacter sp.]